MQPEQCFFNEQIICPNTGRLKSREQVTTHSIPGGWAVWWRCSSCDRWHMTEIMATQEISLLKTVNP